MTPTLHTYLVTFAGLTWTTQATGAAAAIAQAIETHGARGASARRLA